MSTLAYDYEMQVAGMLAAFALFAAGTSLPASASDYRDDAAATT